MDNRQDQEPAQGFDFRRYRGLIIWALMALMFVAIFSFNGADQKGKSELIDYTQLMDRINAGKVKSLLVDKKNYAATGEYAVEGEPANVPTAFTCELTEELSEKVTELCREKKVSFRMVAPSMYLEVLAGILPYILLFAIVYFLFFRQMRGMGGGGGILNFGKSRAVRITSDKVKKTFDDVAGINEAKDEVYEIIEFLRAPERFRALGGRLPRGVLLIGSPGTGKTLLAKAIAGEANVPFFSISGSDFVEMFVGVGASRVRDLFEQAKASAPCIIFLDEIDAVGRKRGTGFSGGHDEREQTLNAILVEMDGFESDQSVIVMAATNRPDVLDTALLRPGRFDRRIYVDLPDLKGRVEILRVHGRNIKLADNIDLDRLARGTPGFSGADLENLMNEAALLAAMRKKTQVEMEDLEEARDKVRWGREKRSRVMSEEDRRKVAWHEAGHALLNHYLEGVSPLHKVTIIQRGRALGSTMQLPEKDEYNLYRKKILSELKLLYGGRVAEELFCDDISSGAANDIERATELARAMVCEWGMSDTIGPVFYGERSTMPAFGEAPTDKRMSDETARKIDAEVREILDNAYRETRKLIEERSVEMRLIVDALMEFEALSGDEVAQLIAESSLNTLRETRKAAAVANGTDKPAADAANPAEKSGAEKPDADKPAAGKTPPPGTTDVVA